MKTEKNFARPSRGLVWGPLIFYDPSFQTYTRFMLILSIINFFILQYKFFIFWHSFHKFLQIVFIFVGPIKGLFKLLK